MYLTIQEPSFKANNATVDAIDNGVTNFHQPAGFLNTSKVESHILKQVLNAGAHEQRGGDHEFALACHRSERLVKLIPNGKRCRPGN